MKNVPVFCKIGVKSYYLANMIHQIAEYAPETALRHI